MASQFRLALIQLSVGLSKTENVKRAINLVHKAANEGAKMIALPEFFTTPCSPSLIAKSAEPLHGETSKALQKSAQDNNVYLIGGTIAEVADDGMIYNTCPVFSPQGEMIASYRKIHMFDVNLPDLQIEESAVVAAGDKLKTFDTADCRVGLGICYDIRFPEVGLIYQNRGCKMLFLAGAFNKITGPAHWDIVLRTRAVDHQMFVAAASQARDLNAPYQSWAHSVIINPWGEILAQAGFEEETIYADIDLNVLEEIRKQMPVTRQRRNDVYSVTDGKA